MMFADGDPLVSSCTAFSPSYRNPVVLPLIVFARRRPTPSYAKLALAPPLSPVSSFRAFHV
jgi:hypothetical protein